MLFIILLLLFLSAFFSCSETVLITLNKFQIRKLIKIKKYKGLKSWVYRPLRFITGILIGNNIVNIAFGTVFTVWFLKNAKILNINLDVASFIAFILISIIMLIFGEVIPKDIGKSKSSTLIKVIYTPIRTVIYIFSPIISFVSFLEKIIIGKGTKRQEKLTRRDFHTFIKRIRHEEFIGKDIESMIYSFLELKKKTIKNAMTLRKDIVAFDLNIIDGAYDKIINKLSKSRIPVYEDTFDNIVGIFYVKDFLSFKFNNTGTNVKSILRRPLFVDSQMKLSSLFRIFKQSRIHVALVTKDKSVVGLITIEDIIEELTGEILDEYDVG